MLLYVIKSQRHMQSIYMMLFLLYSMMRVSLLAGTKPETPWLHDMHHKPLSNDTLCPCFIFGFVFLLVRLELCVQRSESRKAWMSPAHLSVLFSITVPFFYSCNSLEPSIKPIQVEPEAGTIIAS